ncbi:MAG: F0F1 ATP synthase subunit B [Paludibacteraceae bacterium]
MELFTPEVGLIFWMLIPFVIVFLVLAKFAWPAILKGVDQRNKYIDDSLLAARQARDELAKVKASGEAIVEEARKEQSRILAETAKSRDMIVNGAKDKAAEEAAKIIENARQQIALEKEDAIRQIRREVASLSVDISEKVLRKNLGKKNEQMDMIDRLLDEINIPKS